jgi:hypothetical protein
MRISAYLFGLQPLAAEGAIVFAKACELGLEGIVSKREGSFYRSGSSQNASMRRDRPYRKRRAGSAGRHTHAYCRRCRENSDEGAGL